MAKFQFKSQETLSLRQKVAADIRDAIIRGDIKAGEKLREQEISDQMGISRGPVREAIRDLEAMGLVTCLPYKETFVAHVKREEIVDLLLPIRLQLELYSIKYHLERFTPDFFEGLQAITARMDQAAAAGDLPVLVEEDIRFHEQIVLLHDDSSYARQIWSSIANRLRLHFMNNSRHITNLPQMAADHYTLIDALQSGNYDDIAALWERHIRDDDCLLYL
ncbi:GntR family transcriptional regulator [Paenibacillus sp. GCM10027626]|uniref:GntR family transcriptional regulator n=1 Tax=Paenibacillus sp. GCM10027626 TaxID=3273411 RepID=UPI003645AB41